MIMILCQEPLGGVEQLSEPANVVFVMSIVRTFVCLVPSSFGVMLPAEILKLLGKNSL